MEYKELYEMIDENNKVMTESVLSPVHKFKKKLEKLKNSKPKEYSENDEIKRFVDESYDIIDDVARILEKEPDKFRKHEIKKVITFILTNISAVLVVGVGGFITAGFIISLLSTIAIAIDPLIQYLRKCDDIETFNDLMKIRGALIKLKNKKLPDSYKRKIIDMIDKIDNAYEEFSQTLKVNKESVNSIRLEIFESCKNGEITKDEQDMLLNSLSCFK